MDFRIGVAGCGRMGLPMAEALLGAGFSTRGFDIRPRREFGSFADNMRPDPLEFINDRNILLTVVRDIQQTDEVLFDDQALVLNAPQLTHLVICSTLSPRYLFSLKDRIPSHIHLRDAPRSGAAVAALEARLSFMLGGEKNILNDLEPMFAAMGKTLHHTGAFGSGMTAKVLNNLVAASSVATTRCALNWANQLGMDCEKLLSVMHDSSGQTWFGSNFDTIEFAQDGFDKDNTLGIIKKDVESAIDAMPAGTEDELPRALIAAIERLTKH